MVDLEMTAQTTETKTEQAQVILEARDLTIRYSGEPAVKQVSLVVRKNLVTAIIGPSGCGKSTLLRAFNRMNSFIPTASTDGVLLYMDIDLEDPKLDPAEIRKRIGMVFQKPNPFPKSIYKNIAWGPSINGMKENLDQRVESSLRQAALWDEVKDRLHQNALGLSGGQQQRLCLARTLAMEPDVILMDEPCSALDPISTAKIEDLMFELKKSYTIVIVTHNMQQAARVSDYTIFMESGVIIEAGETDQIFTRPTQKRTEEYVTGRFG